MEPITTELRKLMAHTVDGFDLRRPLVECDREIFERLCDNIDAVHEGLEREIESLRRELDRVLGELDEMHKTNGISDNSGSFMQNAEHHTWAPESHYMMLPKDADGVPIRVGDELEGYGYPNGGAYCKAIVGDWGILAGEQECNYQRWLLWSADDVRHHRAPTVEDLIRDAILSCIGHSPEYWDEPIAECATKLQLKEDE